MISRRDCSLYMNSAYSQLYICVNVEKIVECLNVWKEISTRNRKLGRLCDVRYNNLQMFCDDSEKSDSVCCVKRMSYPLTL